jgi:hypothetical protein
MVMPTSTVHVLLHVKGSAAAGIVTAASAGAAVRICSHALFVL